MQLVLTKVCPADSKPDDINHYEAFIMAVVGISMFIKDNAYAAVEMKNSAPITADSNSTNTTVTPTNETTASSASNDATMDDLLFIFTAVPFAVNFFLMTYLYSLNRKKSESSDDKLCCSFVYGAICSFISSYLRIINVLNYRFCTKQYFNVSRSKAAKFNMISVTVTLLAWDIPQIALQSVNNSKEGNWDWLRVGSVVLSVLMSIMQFYGIFKYCICPEIQESTDSEADQKDKKAKKVSLNDTLTLQDLKKKTVY